MFISFEGPDGSGKSTAIKKIAEFLKSKNIDFILTNEPGNPHLKESKIISDLIKNKDSNLTDLSEAMLFAADRSNHVSKIIKPSLAEGKIVLCDRYIDSSLAYQGAGRGIGIGKVKEINEIATDSFYPDLTIFFDVTPEESERRVVQRAEKDRMELAGKDFHQKVYDAYLEIRTMFKDRYVIVDAEQSIDEVYKSVEEIIRKQLNI